jgi:hypothetical protein
MISYCDLLNVNLNAVLLDAIMICDYHCDISVVLAFVAIFAKSGIHVKNKNYWF